jgi:uncharacterized delta-60 repeat protein
MSHPKVFLASLVLLITGISVAIPVVPEEASASSFADGSLDTTFGTGGIVTTNIAIGSSADYARSIAIQPDGKIVIVGESDQGSSRDFAVLRYNANGTLDTTFSEDGKVTTDINNSAEDYARSVAVQSDGKIIVAGDSSQVGSRDFTVVRYNSTSSASVPTPAPPAAIVTTTITAAPAITTPPATSVTPVITAETTNTQATNPLAIKRGKTVTVVALTKSLDLKPRPGSKIALKVRPKDSARCIVTQTGVKVLGKGLCRVTVTVTPKSRQSTVRTVMIKGT